MLCSSAARTVEALQLIRRPPGGHLRQGRRWLYAGDVDELLARVRRKPSTVASALLHRARPGVGALAVMLAGHGDRIALAAIVAKFPTGALAGLAIDEQWSAVEPGVATLEEFWTPR